MTEGKMLGRNECGGVGDRCEKDTICTVVRRDGTDI